MEVMLAGGATILNLWDMPTGDLPAMERMLSTAESIDAVISRHATLVPEDVSSNGGASDCKLPQEFEGREGLDGETCDGIFNCGEEVLVGRGKHRSDGLQSNDIAETIQSLGKQTPTSPRKVGRAGPGCRLLAPTKASLGKVKSSNPVSTSGVGRRSSFPLPMPADRKASPVRRQSLSFSGGSSTSAGSSGTKKEGKDTLESASVDGSMCLDLDTRESKQMAKEPHAQMSPRKRTSVPATASRAQDSPTSASSENPWCTGKASSGPQVLSGLAAAKKFSESLRAANLKATRSGPDGGTRNGKRPSNAEKSAVQSEAVDRKLSHKLVPQRAEQKSPARLREPHRDAPVLGSLNSSGGRKAGALSSTSTSEASCRAETLKVASKVASAAAVLPLVSSNDFNADSKKGVAVADGVKVQAKDVESAAVPSGKQAAVWKEAIRGQENLQIDEVAESVDDMKSPVTEKGAKDGLSILVHTSAMLTTGSAVEKEAAMGNSAEAPATQGQSWLPTQGGRIPIWPDYPTLDSKLVEKEIAIKSGGKDSLGAIMTDPPAQGGAMLWSSRPHGGSALQNAGDLSPVSTLDLRLAEDNLSPLSTGSTVQPGVMEEGCDRESDSDGEADKRQLMLTKSESKGSSIDSAESLEFALLDFIGEVEGMEQDLEYVRHILVTAGIAGDRVPQWYSDHLPIDPAVFEQLELGINFSSNSALAVLDPVRRSEERRQRMLLFDAVNEAVGRRLTPFLDTPPWLKFSRPRVKPRPVGKELLQEVWGEIHDWPVPVSEEVYDILDDAARRDMTKGLEKWNEFAEEEAEMVFDLEAMVLQDLLEEAVCSFAAIEIKRIAKQARQPHKVPWAAASPMVH